MSDLLCGGNAEAEKAAFVAAQFRQAMYQEGKRVQEVTCGCGLTMPLRFAYKCLYCGEFYCQTCAEHHFGKTRAEYNAEKASEPIGNDLGEK